LLLLLFAVRKLGQPAEQSPPAAEKSAKNDHPLSLSSLRATPCRVGTASTDPLAAIDKSRADGALQDQLSQLQFSLSKPGVDSGKDGVRRWTVDGAAAHRRAKTDAAAHAELKAKKQAAPSRTEPSGEQSGSVLRGGGTEEGSSTAAACASSVPSAGQAAGGKQGGLVGSPVLLHGLKSRKDLNGQRGVAKGFDSKRGRYSVEVAAGEDCWIKPDNLQLIDQSSSPEPAEAPQNSSSGQQDLEPSGAEEDDAVEEFFTTGAKQQMAREATDNTAVKQSKKSAQKVNVDLKGSEQQIKQQASKGQVDDKVKPATQPKDTSEQLPPRISLSKATINMVNDAVHSESAMAEECTNRPPTEAEKIASTLIQQKHKEEKARVQLEEEEAQRKQKEEAEKKKQEEAKEAAIEQKREKERAARRDKEVQDRKERAIAYQQEVAAAAGRANKSKPMKSNADWDKFDVDEELTRIEDEDRRTRGLNDKEISNEKILEIMEDQNLSQADKMEKCMHMVGHKDYEYAETEEDKARNESQELMNRMQNPNMNPRDKMHYMQEAFEKRNS